MGGVLQQLLSLSLLQAFALTSVIFTGVCVYSLFYAGIWCPANLPRFGEKDGATRFSWMTRKMYYTDCKRMYKEAYEQYSKKGRTVLVPGMGASEEIILPSSSLKWLASISTEILSQPEAFVELDQAHVTFPDFKVVQDPWQGLQVRREMYQGLEKLCICLDDEMKVAIDTRIGTDTQKWTEITLFEKSKEIIAQASSRFTVGLPMCRNEAYIQKMIPLPDLMVMTTAIVRALPIPLRPTLGRLLSIPMRISIERSKNIFRPLYNERIKTLQRPKSEDPDDHLQLMLRFAQAERPQDLNLDTISMRLNMANFGSVHQTSIMATQLILNILESDKQYNTIALLREEADRCFTASGGVWTKAVAAQMIRVDSCARETMRINAFGNRGLLRKVMVDNVKTEDGIKLPKGALVSILAHPAQCDGDIYEDPETFDPFRFSRQREAAPRAKDGTLSLVSTGPQHIIFGHGHHACPGRFLVDFELKMMVTYLFAKYDVELLPEYNGKRPEAKWVTEATLPPAEGKIRVKRRGKV